MKVQRALPKGKAAACIGNRTVPFTEIGKGLINIVAQPTQPELIVEFYAADCVDCDPGDIWGSHTACGTGHALRSLRLRSH